MSKAKKGGAAANTSHRNAVEAQQDPVKALAQTITDYIAKPMFAWTVRVTGPEMLEEIKDDLEKQAATGVTFRKDSGLSGTAEDLHGLLIVQESCYANMENGNDHRGFGIYFCDHGTAMDDSRWDALNKGADCEWEELETTGGWGLMIIGVKAIEKENDNG